jgi:preprotein translocase subunit SecF
MGVIFGTYSTIAICSSLLFWTVAVNDLQPKETMTLEKM